MALTSKDFAKIKKSPEKTHEIRRDADGKGYLFRLDKEKPVIEKKEEVIIEKKVVTKKRTAKKKKSLF